MTRKQRARFGRSFRILRSPAGVANSSPQGVLFGRRQVCQSLRNLVFREAVATKQNCQVQLGGRNKGRTAVATEPSGATRSAPVTGLRWFGLLATVDAEVAALVVLGLLRLAMDAVHRVGGIEHDPSTGRRCAPACSDWVGGRVRTDRQYDLRLEALVHNTIRGAAGAAILNAELIQARGLLP